MTEQGFEKALSKAAFSYMTTRLNDSSLDSAPFKTSESFEKRISKLIKSQSNLYYKFTLTRARRLLCAAIIIALLLASMLSVGAVREMIANFFVQHFSDHNSISSSQNSEIYPKKIEKLYELSYIPKGYKLVDESIDEFSATYIYYKGTDSLLFQQSVKEDFKLDSDNNATMYSKTINGQNYLISNRDDGCTIVWDNHQYVFWLSSNFDEKASLKMCKSLKIK